MDEFHSKVSEFHREKSGITGHCKEATELTQSAVRSANLELYNIAPETRSKFYDSSPITAPLDMHSDIKLSQFGDTTGRCRTTSTATGSSKLPPVSTSHNSSTAASPIPQGERSGSELHHHGAAAASPRGFAHTSLSSLINCSNTDTGNIRVPQPISLFGGAHLGGSTPQNTPSNGHSHGQQTRPHTSTPTSHCAHAAIARSPSHSPANPMGYSPLGHLHTNHSPTSPPTGNRGLGGHVAGHPPLSTHNHAHTHASAHSGTHSNNSHSGGGSTPSPNHTVHLAPIHNKHSPLHNREHHDSHK
eukprot:gene31767-39244_t